MDCVRSHAQAQPMSYLLLIPAIGRPTPNDVMCMRCMCSGGGKHIKIDLFRTYFCLKILFQTSRLVNYARDKIMLLSPRQSPLNSHHFIWLCMVPDSQLKTTWMCIVLEPTLVLINVDNSLPILRHWCFIQNQLVGMAVNLSPKN